MPANNVLTDDAWGEAELLLEPDYAQSTGRLRRPRIDDRQALSAVIWKLDTGVAWRRLPQTFPNWRTCYGRYRGWRKSGVLADILKELVRQGLIHERILARFPGTNHGNSQTTRTTP